MSDFCEEKTRRALCTTHDVRSFFVGKKHLPFAHVVVLIITLSSFYHTR
jgi:hypothetical protein